MARHTFSIIVAILMLAVLCVSAAGASKPAARLPFAAREAIRQAQARIAAAKSRYERRVRLIELAERQKLKAAELAAMHAGNLRQAEAVKAAIASKGPETSPKKAGLRILRAIYYGPEKSFNLTKKIKKDLQSGTLRVWCHYSWLGCDPNPGGEKWMQIIVSCARPVAITVNEETHLQVSAAK